MPLSWWDGSSNSKPYRFLAKSDITKISILQIHTNTLKTNNNFPPNLRNLPFLLLSLPHPCFYSTVLVVDRYFHGDTLRSAFRPLSNGIPSVLSTCPPHHLLHRRPELFNGEALEKVTCWSWSPKLGEGGDEGGSHIKMAESPRFWWFLLVTFLFMNQETNVHMFLRDMNFGGMMHVVIIAAALLGMLCIGFLSSILLMCYMYTSICYNHIRPWPTSIPSFEQLHDDSTYIIGLYRDYNPLTV